MALDSAYELVVVESFLSTDLSGRRGHVHIRPAAGSGYPSTLYVACSKSLSRDYPVGTRFRIQAKLTDREGGEQYLYSHPRWKVEVLR